MSRCYGTLNGIDADDVEGPESAANKSWNIALTDSTFSRIPGLKFHDLVFGHDLGSGAFSTVR